MIVLGWALYEYQNAGRSNILGDGFIYSIIQSEGVYRFNTSSEAKIVG
jgi:hypothetical protein